MSPHQHPNHPPRPLPGSHHGPLPGAPWPGAAPRGSAGPLGLDDKATGALAHLCFFIVPVVGPVLIALMSPRGHASRQMASQAAAVQIASYVGIVVSYVSSMIAVGVLAHSMTGREVERLAPMLALLPLLVMGLAWLLGLWGSIAGASAANRGVVWRLPLLGRLAEAVLG